MPVVASMGGIAGSQTLTIIIRAVALGQISKENARQLVIKEMKVGVASGFLWSIIIGLIAFLWFDSFNLSLVLGLAILCNLIVAPFAGYYIPVLLSKARLDPALSGAVILTTVTDICGFLVFLGLGTLLLL